MPLLALARALGQAFATIGSIRHKAFDPIADAETGPSMRQTSSLRPAVGLLRTFECVGVARHERAFGPLKAGGRRVEWYRYGDSNPGPVAENHVS